jgi:hypothetical protein
MRIYTSPFVIVDEPNALWSCLAPARRDGNVSASAKFPTSHALLPHHGLADAITPDQVPVAVDAGRMLRSDGVAKATAQQAVSFDRMMDVSA